MSDPLSAVATPSVTVPSPIVPEARLRHDAGEGQGGGDLRRSILDTLPTPNPSPQGGGESVQLGDGDCPVATQGVRIVTLGCRLNAFESEVMRGHATASGLGDAVIVNTCAVTGEAVRQAMQTIRRLRRESPHARIIVTGCAAQTEPDRFAAMPEIDAVVGNAEKMRAETFQGLSI